MKTLIVVVVMVLMVGMAWGESITFSVQNTPHKIRFQGTLLIGGDITIFYSDYELWGDQTAFYKWLENMTIKELREKGYLTPFTNFFIVEEKIK